MKSSPKKPDPVEAERGRIRMFLQTELADFENQQKQFYASMMLADGAAQATRVALRKLDEPNTPSEKGPTP
jgi:hypothetical protein